MDAAYLRARISGAIREEIDWRHEHMECSGTIRPTDGGIRLRFSRPTTPPSADQPVGGPEDLLSHDRRTSPSIVPRQPDRERLAVGDAAPESASAGSMAPGTAGSATATLPDALVLVFGITLREGRSGRNLPVNLTVIREGRGEFYSTQGDDKCMLDEVTQQPIAGIPRRSRSYRIVGRGYCTEPARAVRGTGAVLLSRFDFAGRVDFGDPTDRDPPPR